MSAIFNKRIILFCYLIFSIPLQAYPLIFSCLFQKFHSCERRETKHQKKYHVPSRATIKRYSYKEEKASDLILEKNFKSCVINSFSFLTKDK
jgi:hypothetical protein